MPTVATLKERLENTSLPKLEATLDHLHAYPPDIYRAGWHGYGMDGGACAWRGSRLRDLHHNRISALQSTIDKRKKQVEKDDARKAKAKDKEKEKKLKTKLKAREKAKEKAKKAKARSKAKETAKKAKAKAGK